MQLVYGNYPFPVDGVNVGTRIENVLNAAGIPLTRKVYFDVSGDLLVTPGQADPAINAQIDMSAQTDLLVLALRSNYQDLVFKDDNGNPTATVLTNANSLSGVVISSGPHFPGGVNQSEYVSRRKFSFTAMAEYVVVPGYTALVSFNESLSFSGGMPIRVMCRSINLPPIDQITWPYTEYEVTQSGSAIGFLDWPFGGPKAMPPLKFPAATLREAPKIDPSGPDRTGNNYRNFHVRWTARFASAVPLIASPTLWTL